MNHKYDISNKTGEFMGYPCISFNNRPEVLGTLGKEETDRFFKYLERCFIVIELMDTQLIIRYYELSDELLMNGINMWMNNIDDRENSGLAIYGWIFDVEMYYLIFDRTTMNVEKVAKLKNFYPSQIKDVTPSDEGRVIVRREITFEFTRERSHVINQEGIGLFKEIRNNVGDFLNPDKQNIYHNEYNPLVRDNGIKG